MSIGKSEISFSAVPIADTLRSDVMGIYKIASRKWRIDSYQTYEETARSALAAKGKGLICI
jgi:hypothetical protein